MEMRDWIPVGEGLPGANVDVLVSVQDIDEGGHVFIGIDCILDEVDGSVWGTYHRAKERVLAWMPMPSIYQPQSSDGIKGAGNPIEDSPEEGVQKMDDIRTQCTLSDIKELRRLIVENPDLPLLVFCGENPWTGEYQYETADIATASIEELTLYKDRWLDKDEYGEELSEDLSYRGEYEDLSDREFTEMIDKKVAGTEFTRAIVIYVG